MCIRDRYVGGPDVIGAQRLGALAIWVGAVPSDRLLFVLKQYQPTVIWTSPSYAWHLGEVAKEKGYDPVSYTHLDVYKRQVLHHGGRLDDRVHAVQRHGNVRGPGRARCRGQMCIRDRPSGGALSLRTARTARRRRAPRATHQSLRRLGSFPSFARACCFPSLWRRPATPPGRRCR